MKRYTSRTNLKTLVRMTTFYIFANLIEPGLIEDSCSAFIAFAIAQATQPLENSAVCNSGENEKSNNILVLGKQLHLADHSLTTLFQYISELFNLF